MKIWSAYVTETSASRTDAWIAENCPFFASRKSAKNAIREGLIKIDGTVPEPQARPAAGSLAEVFSGPEKVRPVYRLEMPVLYEDECLAVVQKPAGIPVNGNAFRTVERSLPGILKQGTGSTLLPAPVPVHRLDSSTAGLLICAKTGEAAASLGRQFETRTVKKIYRALVSGWLGESGIMEQPVEGRPARTLYRTVSRVPSVRNCWISDMELIPETGRTHQLRQHCAAAGCPIMGDRLYGEKGNVLFGKGLFLFASSVSFDHPVSGERVSVTAEIPRKFRTLLLREEMMWNSYNAGY